MRALDDKIDKYLNSIEQTLDLKSANYCIPGILSICGAGPIWDEQRICRFAVKSDFANKCMYYNALMDRHCDCLDAQKDAVTILEQ